MTTALFIILFALALLVNAPSALVLYQQSCRRKSDMIIPEFQTVIDELNASVTAVTALKDAAAAAPTGPTAQDLTDTLAAVQAAADAVKAAAGQ